MSRKQNVKVKTKLLILRPFYGITVHGDMHGDLGVSDHQPQIYPDLSLIYAATIASKDPSIDLHVIDANLNRIMPVMLMEKLKEHYDVIIIKAEAPTIHCDLDLARTIKIRYPDSRIVLAGYVARILADWIKTNIPEIDEIALVPLEFFVHKMISGKEEIGLDDLPTPDFTLFPYEGYRDMDGILRGSLHTSRGCTIGCTYCPYARFYGNKMSFRSNEKICEDIEYLLSLGIKKISFRDQYFTYKPERTASICRMIIDKGLKFNWSCETRLESVDTELIDLMIKAGMDTICFGVETASDEIHRYFHRPLCDEVKLKRLVNHLNSKNIFTLAFFMIGFPQDTWWTVKDTFELAERIGTTSIKISFYEPNFIDLIPDDKKKPSLFIPFTNSITINPCKNLSRHELEFLADHMTNLYHMEQSRNASGKNNYLKGIYEYHFVHQKRFHDLVKNLKENLNDGTIFKSVLAGNRRRIIKENSNAATIFKPVLTGHRRRIISD